MPDPLRQTISGTETATLFDINPYETMWMLYRKFAYGEETAKTEHVRMDWGKRLEPLLIEAASQDLKLEVRPNRGGDGNQIYVRNGLFGCTRDAEIICPDRGPGALETKAVFDYKVWMEDWAGGNRPPRHHETQIQCQMKVGDGSAPYKWGVEAVWIAGEMHYYERKPIPKFWEAMDKEAERFFATVAAKNEPDPFGLPVENPLLNEVFPIDEDKILDFREHANGRDIAEDVRMFVYHRSQRLGHKRAEDALKLKFRSRFKDAGKILLPHGINLKAKQNKKDVSFKAYVPQDLPEGRIEEFDDGE